MNYSDYRFTLDIQIHQAQVSVPVTLNDTARKLYIGLTDGRKPYTINDGCRAVFAAKKPDGTTILNDCVIEKNTTIVYEFSKNTTNCVGVVNCEVRLYDASGKELTSPQFIIVVDEKVVRDEEVSVSESEATAISNMLISEQARVTAEKLRVAAENVRAASATRMNEATDRANEISQTLEDKLALGEFKGEQGEPGEKGATPVYGVDYWTPEEKEAIDRIVMDKSSMIGGFLPVNAPVWESGIKPKNTLAKITEISVSGGKCIVTFNENEELFTDGSLEAYNAGTSLVLLNNDGKSEYGWSGINFDGASTRYARIESSATSHSGGKVLRVKSPYSSIWKSLKLKPNTDYTISFWCKGKAGDHFSNITIAGRATEGNIHYANNGGAFLCDKNAPDYRILKDIWYHAGDAGEYLETANTWQKFSLNFSTCDEEYVDICIYFGTSYGDFYFDDFSIKEVLGEVFTASYDADKVQGYDWLKVGSYFLVDCHSTHFSRFEYASSLAIVKLYRHISDSAKTAYQYAVEAGFEGTEANYKALLLMNYAPLVHSHDDYTKVEGGYYNGTNASSLSLTFSFVPKVIFIVEKVRYYQASTNRGSEAFGIIFPEKGVIVRHEVYNGTMATVVNDAGVTVSLNGTTLSLTTNGASGIAMPDIFNTKSLPFTSGNQGVATEANGYGYWYYAIGTEV